MIRVLLLAFGILAMPAWAADSVDFAGLASLPNVANPAPDIVTAGRLQSGDISTIARAGVRHVINLRAENETPGFDEAAAVRAAGMTYQNLPIHGVQDLTAKNVMRFDRLITAAETEPTLIHCASSNRVGAMEALRAAWIKGRPADAALAEGRRWGLKSLEPAVKKLLLETKPPELSPPSPTDSRQR